MWQLFQFPLCPFSRKVRLVLAEKGVAHELVRENPWEKRDEFVDLNPAGETPVMVEADQMTTTRPAFLASAAAFMISSYCWLRAADPG